MEGNYSRIYDIQQISFNYYDIVDILFTVVLLFFEIVVVTVKMPTKVLIGTKCI